MRVRRRPAGKAGAGCSQPGQPPTRRPSRPALAVVDDNGVAVGPAGGRALFSPLAVIILCRGLSPEDFFFVIGGRNDRHPACDPFLELLPAPAAATVVEALGRHLAAGVLQ